ncbi:hypothetical protein HMI54_002167 [Coelomomyces lativittatus]|nr:hypothetical protein HMI56_007518 [Coelomomyces lativittatus]KAJ1517083.1 hypothetical protein HMI55_000667 [Coelomomyces lativittatus]KAJ1518178.1 hypothetical protein HMI54_002167 [Coelomomyces lativittatus]
MTCRRFSNLFTSISTNSLNLPCFGIPLLDLSFPLQKSHPCKKGSLFSFYSSSSGLPFTSQRFTPSLENAKERLPKKRSIPMVKNVIMVTSAKGGVGKSTVAAHLAYSLASLHYKVGILDTDVHGPSMPTLLNIQGITPELTSDHKLKPVVNYNLQCMSMGLLAPSGSAVAWRGLMVMKALSQLLFQVAWDPPLDYLVMDLPPGTSDIHLSIIQQVEISGALVVSTGHSLSIADMIKGIDLLNRCHVPILGIVHSMAYFTCPDCTHSHPLFKTTTTSLSTCTQVPVLSELPYEPTLQDPQHTFLEMASSTTPSLMTKKYLELASLVVTKLHPGKDAPEHTLSSINTSKPNT